jgi:hypothetical protein
LLLAGLAFDALARAEVDTVAATLAVIVVGVGLLVASRSTNRTAWLLVAAAIAVGVWLPLRTSPWLVPLDVLTAGGLLVVAATFARDGRLRDLTFAGGIRRLFDAPSRVVQGPPVLLRMVTDGWRRRPDLPEGRGPELLRGLLLAVPVVTALAVLLASADTVFASIFRLPVEPGTGFGHVALIVVGVLLTLPLLLAAAAPTRTEPPAVDRLGRVETTVLLAGVVALYAAFAVSQLVVARGGARHVLDTADLSYAEYARTGFFQLLAVAGLTLLLLLAVRGTVLGRRALVVLAEATVVLTLVIVGVAIRRLDLYDDAYGLTMLRLSSTVTAWWIGGVFVLVGLAFAGVRRRHDWLAGAVAVLAIVTLVGFNAVDPEAVVVRHNVARDTGEVPYDVEYAGGLSDDAVPALVDALDDLDPAARQWTIHQICHDDGGPVGWLGWNRSAARADEARDQLGC